uniref:Uncharacterized protein n=1 Tax=Lepeophtheirus salmonis TaxID=72036 RepID=A0A0K2V8Y6_LEPSM
MGPHRLEGIAWAVLFIFFESSSAFLTEPLFFSNISDLLTA